MSAIEKTVVCTGTMQFYAKKIPGKQAKCQANQNTPNQAGSEQTRLEYWKTKAIEY